MAETTTIETPKARVIRGKRSPTGVWIVRAKGKRGTTYRIRWVDPQTGRGLSEACGDDFKLARTRRDQKRGELRDGITGKLPSKTLSELIAAVPEFMAGSRPTSIDNVVDSLESLKAAVGDVRVTEVKPGLMMQFRAARLKQDGRLGRKISPATINKDSRQICSALTKARKAGWLNSNPLIGDDNGRLSEPQRGVRVVIPEQLEKIVAVEVDPMLKLVWKLAYQTGMRRAELANLRWEWCGAEVFQIVNTPEAGEFTKSNGNRTVPITPEIRATLAAASKLATHIIDGGKLRPKYPHVFTWPDGRPMLKDFLTKRFIRAAKAAGVKATLHDERRSWSTLAQAAGVDRMTVKDLGGWSDVSVVERHYTNAGHVLPALRTAMEKIGKAIAAG